MNQQFKCQGFFSFKVLETPSQGILLAKEGTEICYKQQGFAVQNWTKTERLKKPYLQAYWKN